MKCRVQFFADVDECALGSHNCGENYLCRNMPGSYRCYSRKCSPGEAVNPTTGKCESILCPIGYEVKNDKCEGKNCGDLFW